MKKILIAFAGDRYSESTFEFIRRLNQLQPVFAAGLFLPAFDFSKIWIFSDPVSGQTYVPDIYESEVDEHQNAAQTFRAFCDKEDIKYQVHMDTGQMTVTAIVEESRFADLLIINNEKFYEYLGNDSSNPTLKDALHRAECPVLILPERFDFPERIVLAYDGSASSVFAIKQFIYLFPELTSLDVILSYSSTDVDADIPKAPLLQELLSGRFRNVIYHKAAELPKKLFEKIETEDKRTLVVSGSFGRSMPSQFFKKSYVAEILNRHQLPLFIAHCS